MPNFLLEIACEEIPASYIAPAAEFLRKGFQDALTENGAAPETLTVTATPRRFAVFAADLPEALPKREKEVTGPKWDAAFDADGKPTKAAVGFSRKHGASPEDLKPADGAKGKVCMLKVTEGLIAKERARAKTA